MRAVSHGFVQSGRLTVKNMYNTKIFVCHYHALTERKAYLDTVLPVLDIPHEYSMSFTRDNLKEYEHCFSMADEVIDEKCKYMVNKCTKADLGNGCSDPIKALCLEHVKIYNSIVKENLDFGIILEDDAVFVDNFNEKLKTTIDNLPADWDVVFLTNGCEGRAHHLAWGREGSPTINNFVKMIKRTSWTGGAYMVKKHMAEKFAKHIFPIVYPPDWELNYLLNFCECNTYWLEDPIVYEGSNPVSGHMYKYGTSVCR